MAKKLNLVGSWAFLIGVILALVIGIFSGLDIADMNSSLMTSVMIVLGIIIGLFNIADKETMPFLMSGIALIIASVFGMSIMIQVKVASATLAALLLIFIPATIIVAIRNVFSLAKE
jgi:hypothetical protein